MMHPRVADQEPLPDLLHDLLPNLQPWRLVPELMMLVPVLGLSGILLYRFDQHALNTFRTFLWAHASLLAMRGSSFVLTLLPDASQQCRESPFVGGCHDLMFSGHVALMVLTLALARRNYALPRVATALFVAATALSVALVIAVRNHYSVDVLVALFLAPLVEFLWSTHPHCVALAVLPREAAEEAAEVRACCGGRRGTRTGHAAVSGGCSDADGGGKRARDASVNKRRSASPSPWAVGASL